MRRRALAFTAALIGLTLAALACNTPPIDPLDPDTSSETHWLRPCDTDAVCGPLACVCNVCTLRCEQSSDCGELGDARCIIEGRGPHNELCVDPDARDGVCLPGCDVTEGLSACSAAAAAVGRQLTCLDNACIPTRIFSEHRKIDILMIVDNSGSMCEEQDAMRQEAALFIEQLLLASADFHLAVITTDMEDPAQAGRFQNVPRGEAGPACTIPVDISDCPAELPLIMRSSDPLYLDNGSPDLSALQRDLGCLVTVGTQGTGFEKGLEAMRAALSPPLLDDHNAGFLRADAFLAVIFLTDENDCSHDGSVEMSNGNICEWERDRLTPVAEYIDFLRGLKESDERLILGGVIAPDSGLRYQFGEEVLPSCTSELGTGYAGYRYQDVINAYPQKTIVNICAPDFTEGVSSLAMTISTTLRTR